MEIYAYAEKTAELTRLTNARGYDAEASYSPDGQWIAYSSMRDAYNRTLTPAEQKQLSTDPSYFGEIYIMKADGSGEKRLTTEPGYDGGPFFMKDGQHIVWRHFDEQGLIADLYGALPPLDQGRTLDRSAIAAGEKGRLLPKFLEQRSNGDCRRRLPAAASGEIADADHRKARTVRHSTREACLGAAAVEPAQGRERRCDRPFPAIPPEGRPKRHVSRSSLAGGRARARQACAVTRHPWRQ